jgi:NitT/TauT family transport system ATP-binding protein
MTDLVQSVSKMSSRIVPQIEFVSVSKRYSNTAMILEAVDLTIFKGQFVALIGPSGCGKSTILKLIAGLTSPTQGAIKVDGMSPKNARETVSYIFQDATLLPWRPVEQNVSLGLELDGMGKGRRHERAAALLKLVGLDHVARAYPRELSGGMKMRVSIARALATSPKLLLMDEPFAALDEMSRDHLNEELLRLQSEQKWTGVFVTHSVEEAVFLSSQIVVLAPNPGRIHEIFAIDLGFPRTAVLRETPEFSALVARISQALRGGMKQETTIAANKQPGQQLQQ